MAAHARVLTGPPQVDPQLLHKAQADTYFVFEGEELSETPENAGMLFISESVVAWWSQGSNRGFELDYSTIVLHAVCRDTTHFPRPCLYCQLDFGIEGQAEIELRIVPADATTLDGLFVAMSECQALNPDPEDMDDYEDDGNGAYADADEEASGVYGRDDDYADEDTGPGGDVELTAEGKATMDRLNNLIVTDPNGFGQADPAADDDMFNDAD